MTELTTTMRGRSDVPADVKASFEAFDEGTRRAWRRSSRRRRRTRRRRRRARRQPRAWSAKLGQAKNGLMGGMSAGEQTMRAYTEVKAQTPRTIADLNAVIAKARR